jgi:NADH-quinone oxidoreductase subunit E
VTISVSDIAAKTKEIISQYPAKEASLIEVLHDIHREFNYLPADALREASAGLGVPIAKVYAVASFYKGFSLEPRGKYVIRVCTGTACHVRGADRNIDEIKRCIDLEPGETTADMNYTLDVVNCVGACAMAPVIVVNKKYYRNSSTETVHEILGLKAPSTSDDSDEGGDN